MSPLGDCIYIVAVIEVANDAPIAAKHNRYCVHVVWQAIVTRADVGCDIINSVHAVRDLGSDRIMSYP